MRCGLKNLLRLLRVAAGFAQTFGHGLSRAYTLGSLPAGPPEGTHSKIKKHCADRSGQHHPLQSNLMRCILSVFAEEGDWSTASVKAKKHDSAEFQKQHAQRCHHRLQKAAHARPGRRRRTSCSVPACRAACRNAVPAPAPSVPPSENCPLEDCSSLMPFIVTPQPAPPAAAFDHKPLRSAAFALPPQPANNSRRRSRI